MKPYTQRLHVHWARSLAYYERRIEILRRLEGAGMSGAFRVSPDSVSRRLPDGSVEIEVAGTGVEAEAFGPDSNIEQLESALQLILDMAEPPTIHQILVMLQYVEPLNIDYDKARAVSGRTLFGALSPRLPVADWAVLLDAEENEGVSPHFEFGVVSRAELPARLSRQVGAIGSRGGARDQHRWSLELLPDVAFFMDWIWTWKGRVAGSDGWSQVRESWQRALAEASAVGEEVMQNIGLADAGKEADHS